MASNLRLMLVLLSTEAASAWTGSAAGMSHRVRSHIRMEEPLPSGAKELASALNPILGYWDPLNLARADFWGEGSEFSYAWLRHAEIKHGRAAMAAFVGFCVQSSGAHWPFPLQGGGVEQSWYAAGLTPPEQWDALPFISKVQIVGFIGFLEWWSEFAPDTHYTKGGKPGYFPPFNPASGISLSQSPNPFPVPNLYLPFGGGPKTPEAKERGLLVEINNGRLAMIGIFGFLAEEKIPGAVPALQGLIQPYAGDVMVPF